MSDPSVAVVIPVHRQPLLLADAVESVLRQRTNFDYRIVLVNDGCPFSETDEVCRSYARRYPERIRYLRQQHRGISAARNAGAELARELWPSVQAVQFLNADDRLTARALHQGFDSLLRSEKARTLAANLSMLTGNAVAHAPLVARTALDRGLRFDESVPPGLEDRDFAMQCMREGLPCVSSPTMDAQQRRPVSANGHTAITEGQTTSSAFRTRHDSWCTPRLALELEHEESPRFAIYLIDDARVMLTSDPARNERSIPLCELAGQLARAQANPQLDDFPPFVVVTSGAFLRTARHGRFASGLFWLMQYELSRSNAAMMAATLTEQPGTEYAYDVLPPASLKSDAPTPPAILLMRRHTLLEYLNKSNGAQWRQLVAARPDELIQCRELRYIHPDSERESRPDALEGLAALIDAIKPELEKQKRICLRHKNDLQHQGDSVEPSRRLFGSGPVFPKVLDRSQVHVGFVLPICRFGGADRATMNLGREARRRGWTPHLFVIGSGTAQLLSEFRDTFETITVVEPWQLWQPDGLLGLLGTMDVVVNNLSTPTNDVFKLLRRHGIKTICHLHSVIISSSEMPSGQAYEILRHDKDVDGVIVISKKLRSWCTAWGIPREKLIYAPNAPSFEVSDELVRTTMVLRRERTDGQPLRILYLGRFDWEKGMDRLLAIHEQTRSADFPVEWRIVGGRVCGSVTTTDEEFEAVQSVMTPPVMTRSGLARLYAWADVVIMVSRFEGVPLTLLEAQRMGCVVLSTNVGAIGEIVESGTTGFLFPNDLDTPALVAQMMDCLRQLQADRTRLLEIAQASAKLRSQTTWSVNTQSFADFVESLLAPAVK